MRSDSEDVLKVKRGICGCSLLREERRGFAATFSIHEMFIDYKGRFALKLFYL